MKIRTRIFLVFALVAAGGIYFLVQWITDDLRPRYLESLEEPLVDVANLLAGIVGNEYQQHNFDPEQLRQIFRGVYQRRFQANIYALEKERVDMRVYVTDIEGIVVFDSYSQAEGQDYSRWNDVYRTLQGGYGARATHEDEGESPVLYIAAPIIVDDEIIGVLSVGKPARNVDRFLEMAKYQVSGAGLLAAAIVLSLGLILYAWVSRPLEKLIRYAGAVKAGQRVSLPKLGRNEIGMMGAAMEEMRQALAGRDYAQHYVQTLTHELKSPLAAIRGAAELLDEDMPVDERSRFMTNIRTEAERLQELVDRLLELAALEKRQALDKIEAVDIEVLVKDVVASLEPLAAQRNVTVSAELSAGLIVQGEAFLLRQAISNLVRNALEFSPVGGCVEVRAESLSDGSIALQVSDDGPGVPEYAESRVYERFYSLPRPDSGKKSTGLGLSFVREVADLHGGTIRLVNRDEDGVVAELMLPVLS